MCSDVWHHSGGRKVKEKLSQVKRKLNQMYGNTYNDLAIYGPEEILVAIDAPHSPGPLSWRA
jgi:hypothetical protein